MKVGILGCGVIAQSMATTLIGIQNEGKYDITLEAVAARDIDKAKDFAKKNNSPKAYGSYEELVSDSDIDLVYVATPHSHHFEHMNLCIDHGKNVLCEKAFTANRKQAEDILKKAEEKGILVTEAMWVRYMPLTHTLQDILKSNVIGEITNVSANLYYPIDMVQRIYDPALAGGALLDVGVYTLTFAAICLGEKIEKMTADCVKFDTGVDSQSIMALTYSNNVMATCSCGARGISDRKGIITGRKGYIIVENINNPESITVFDYERNIIAEHVAPQQITGYEYQVYACKEALDKGLTECPDCTHEQTLGIMSLMDQARAQMGIVFPFE